MSPIERAAEAVFTHLRGTNELACCGKWSAERFAEYTGRHEEGWVYIDGPIKPDALVRAVLQAIRKPSEGMMRAGERVQIAATCDECPCHTYDLGDRAREVWETMSDAALSE